jgi:hypothetical protein
VLPCNRLRQAQPERISASIKLQATLTIVAIASPLQNWVRATGPGRRRLAPPGIDCILLEAARHAGEGQHPLSGKELNIKAWH